MMMLAEIEGLITRCYLHLSPPYIIAPALEHLKLFMISFPSPIPSTTTFHWFNKLALYQMSGSPEIFTDEKTGF